MPRQELKNDESEPSPVLPKAPLDAARFHGCVEFAVVRSSRWSRTFLGISDTSTSEEKPALVCSGELLKQIVTENFRETARFLNGPEGIFRADLVTPSQLEELIERSAEIVNRGLLSDRHSLYRTWPTKIAGQPDPAAIPELMAGFCRELIDRLRVPAPDYVALAAFFERRFNGEIHPLSDGCSRLARVWAATLLARDGHCYPAFDTREEFFVLMNSSWDEWERGYRLRVAISDALHAKAQGV